MAGSLIIIAHNLRSAHNIGSLMRTCEGAGVHKLYLTGYTPHPPFKGDARLPHIALKAGKQVNKTALGAENTLNWTYENDINIVISSLKKDKYKISALEQKKGSIMLNDLKMPSKLALLLGNEVSGVEKELIKKMDFITEIPMKGKKESFNVASAASMAIYHCLYVK